MHEMLLKQLQIVYKTANLEQCPAFQDRQPNLTVLDRQVYSYVVIGHKTLIVQFTHTILQYKY